MIQIGGVYIYMLLSAKKRAYFCRSIVIEMGRVLRYISKVSGSGFDVTLPNIGTTQSEELIMEHCKRKPTSHLCQSETL